VLDELNLAPSPVLEALNRLLDDNRELVVPETQEVVRPHPHFMLFATQVIISNGNSTRGRDNVLCVCDWWFEPRNDDECAKIRALIGWR